MSKRSQPFEDTTMQHCKHYHRAGRFLAPLIAGLAIVLGACDAQGPLGDDNSDPAVLTMAVTDGEALESDPNNTGSVTFTRTGGDMSKELVFWFGLGGSASVEDYEGLDAWFGRIAPGETQTTIVVKAVNDAQVEGDENVTFTIWDDQNTANPSYVSGTEGAVSVTIKDNDQPIDFTVDVTPPSITLGQCVDVTLSLPSGSWSCTATSTSTGTGWMPGEVVTVNTVRHVCPTSAGTQTYGWTCNGTTRMDSTVVSLPNNTAPTCTITAPANGATFVVSAGGTVSVPFTGTATDADGTVSRVEFYRNNNLLETDNTAPYGLQSSMSLGVGTYSLKMKCYDDDGASGEQTVSITVNQGTIGQCTQQADCNDGFAWTDDFCDTTTSTCKHFANDCGGTQFKVPTIPAGGATCKFWSGFGGQPVVELSSLSATTSYASAPLRACSVECFQSSNMSVRVRVDTRIQWNGSGLQVREFTNLIKGTWDGNNMLNKCMLPSPNGDPRQDVLAWDDTLVDMEGSPTL